MEIKFKCESDIELRLIESKKKISDYIDMLCLDAYSRLDNPKENVFAKRTLTKEAIEEYLMKKRRYVQNIVSGKIIYTHGFVCVSLDGNCISVWHDTRLNPNVVVLKDGFLTGLPITLNYMESI